jgi:thiamine-monophosphate kinase
MVKHISRTEQQVIRGLSRRVRGGDARRAGVALGIGDDCAIFRPRAGEELLFTTDMLIEDTHFRRATHSAEDIGWKALARGLSDIAAMGGDPRFCLVSLAVAPWFGPAEVDGFFGGLLRLARQTGTVLAGGDLSHGAVLAVDIVVCGAAPRGKALRRSTARAGDAIYVSGSLGGSAVGLESRGGRAWKRHLRPEPRLALGNFLRSRVHASSAMDLSDGLSLDLQRMCQASGLSAEIEAPPRFPGASLPQALHGGEDYELLFTVAPSARVPAEFEGVPLTRIGFMRKGRAGRVKLAGQALPPLGYDHFRA